MAAAEVSAQESLNNDRPIRNLAEDKLGRRPFAEAVVRQIAALPQGESYVLGLTGGPGSGKSSLLNLIEELILLSAVEGDRMVLRFDPWAFSANDNLVMELMIELSLQLIDRKSVRLRDIGNRFEYLTELVSPSRHLPKLDAGEDPANAAHLGTSAKRYGSYKMRRRDLEEALSEVNVRIVVLIDNVDRLPPLQLRQLMMTVRTIVNLPNLIYLLAFERPVVEVKLAALAPLSGEGRTALDRTCQLEYDIPAVETSEWAVFVTTEINRFIKRKHRGPFSAQDWNDVFYSVMLPLFATPREVYRYANALPLTLDQIGAEVALVDVLTLEALRIVLPEVFARLPAAEGALTTPLTDDAGQELPLDDQTRQRQKDSFDELLRAGGKSRGVVRELCYWLFPHSRRFLGDAYRAPGWRRAFRKGRRVGHPDVLRFYLKKTLPEGSLPAHIVDAALSSLGDQARLSALLTNLGPEGLEHLLHRLEDYEHDFPPAAVATALPVLLNQSVRLREKRRDPLDPGADRPLLLVVGHMLRRVGDDLGGEGSERVALVDKVLADTVSLSRRLDVLRLCGGEAEGPIRQALLPAKECRRFSQRLRAEVIKAAPERLKDERDLFGLLRFTAQEPAATQRVRALAALDDNEVFCQLLHSALSVRFVSDPRSPLPAREAVLPWDELATLLDADRLKRRLQEVSEKGVGDRVKEAVQLAGHYASGWRPSDVPAAPAPTPAIDSMPGPTLEPAAELLVDPAGELVLEPAALELGGEMLLLTE